MKLLYLSCHSILEYDELKLFEELDIDYFSLGSYVIPTKPVDPIRPALMHQPDKWLTDNAPPRDNIPQEFIDKFDVIVLMHADTPEGNWIAQNWDKFKKDPKRRVIWRTIGQSTQRLEELMKPYRDQGLEIVRYSFKEANIPHTAGSDKVIRFYKDPGEFAGWNGADKMAITIAQDMKHRGEYCNYDAFEYFAKEFRVKLYGPHNENAGELNGGLLSYEEMKQRLRDARVYIYTGTQPASYTLNFIEAMMTGIPVVALGPKFATSLNLAGDVYEIPDIIQNGVNGYWSDNLDELRKRIVQLLDDHQLARRIGNMGRETAIRLFGKETIKSIWKDYLKV